MLWVGRSPGDCLVGRNRSALVAALGIATVALAGCGSTSHQSRQVAESREFSNWVSYRFHEPPGFISVDVPVDVKPLPPVFTCDGADRSIPMRWGSVPPHTAEVDMFLLARRYSHGQPQFNWSLANIQTSVREIKVGSRPAGAIVGRNYLGDVGYFLCPPKGQTFEYTAEVYMLPHKIPVARGFDPIPVRDEAIRESIGRGVYAFSYKRAP
jgi:phosphatidylethanolamine-binding protein (PEBP) family uncharacterized protein